MNKSIFLKYDNFSNALIKTNGNASISSDNNIILTPIISGTYNQIGSAYYTNKICLSNNGSFSTHFVFKLTTANNNPYNRGDGFTFVIQSNSNTAIGAGGEGLGYSGITNSLAIEFDTFKNGGTTGDINNNHSGIDVNGSVTSVFSVDLSSFDIAKIPSIPYYVWIDYDSNTQGGILEVRINNSNTRPTNKIISATNFNLAALLNTKNTFVGFTGAAGQVRGEHRILSWYFDNKYDPIDVNNNNYVESPKLSSVSISSDNVNPNLAQIGNIVTLKFTSSMSITNINVEIAGRAATMQNPSVNNYEASITMASNDQPGPISFSIAFKDAQGNSVTPITCTTDGSYVLFDNTVLPSRGIKF